MSKNQVLESLRAAVAAAPTDGVLRLHFAELLLDAGCADDAIREVGVVLADDPSSNAAKTLMARAMTSAQPSAHAVAAGDFDWSQAETELGDVVAPMFVEGDAAGEPDDAWEVERVTVRLDDVGGLTDVKERLEIAFLGPLRNPQLRQLYGKQLRGGLLLYGPPGCGKSFIARALAGELGAGLIAVSIHDVLDMWVGSSERNLHELFQLARRSAPCVLFIDELDALGQRRSQLHTSAMRVTVNQLLAELDGVGSDNEGIFVLAATNHPWDVDPALRRPGRFDRMVLVLPPDAEARKAIFHTHLRERPVEGTDLAKLAQRSEGLSGADIAHVCETAAEHALADAVKTGEARLIAMHDLEAALAEVRPSTPPWFETARNVALFANGDGSYDELLAYLKRSKKL